MLLTLFAALLFSLSCAARKPVTETLKAEPCSAKTLKLLHRNTSSLRTLKGTLQIHLNLEEPGYGGRVQAGLAAERPDKARLKLYVGFSNLVDVAIDGDSLWAFIPPKGTLLLGSAEDTASFFAPRALLTALREVLFPGEFCLLECRSCKVRGGICRIEDDFAGGRRTSFVDVRNGTLQDMHLVNEEGDEWVTVGFRRYKRSGRIRFPREIRISFPLAGLQMKLSFDRLKLNSPIDEGSFRLDVPPGTTVKRFEELQLREAEQIEREEILRQ